MNNKIQYTNNNHLVQISFFHIIIFKRTGYRRDMGHKVFFEKVD